MFWKDDFFSTKIFVYDTPGSFFRCIYDLEQLINSGELIGLMFVHEINIVLVNDIIKYNALSREEKNEWKKGSAVNIWIVHKDIKNQDLVYNTTNINSFDDLMRLYNKKNPQNQEYNILFDRLVKALDKNKTK